MRSYSSARVLFSLRERWALKYWLVGFRNDECCFIIDQLSRNKGNLPTIVSGVRALFIVNSRYWIARVKKTLVPFNTLKKIEMFFTSEKISHNFNMRLMFSIEL